MRDDKGKVQGWVKIAAIVFFGLFLPFHWWGVRKSIMSVLVIAGTIAGACAGSFALVKVGMALKGPKKSGSRFRFL